MTDMPSITQIDIWSLDVAITAPFKVAIGEIDHTANILVRIHSSDGLYGLGEGAPTSFITGETQATALEAARDLARLLIGKNPLAIDQRVSEMDAYLTGNSATKCAFDVALYDLLAKRAGLPLYALLGGTQREIHTDNSVGIADPETMAQQALDIKGSGFHAVKVKLGTNRIDDVSRIRAIREAVGDDMLIRIDANQGWDRPTAVLTLQELFPFGIQYCEEPVAHWNNEALQQVRQESPIPITADESMCDHHDAFRLASMGASDYFNIKLAKSGGLHKALKINAIAESAGMKCMFGCMFETRLGLSAAAHLMSARPNIAFANLDAAFFLSEDPVTGGLTYEGSRMTVPDTPGHGADIRPDFLEKSEHFSVSNIP
jgi:L-alanine-DL-glutamate epimerase-like enolase superfamily enzyme